MGDIHAGPLVRPLTGLLAREPALFDQAVAELKPLFGPVAKRSEAIPFQHTDYYQQEMGADLIRQYMVFEKLSPAEDLADWKIRSQALEQALGLNPLGGRKINIDPGYLAPGKLVLASTKDHEHRIYLRQGIYAEMTLKIRQGHFQPWEWTYPDYAAAKDFFDQAYQDYLRVLKTSDR